MVLVLRYTDTYEPAIEDFCKNYNPKYYIIKRIPYGVEIYKRENFEQIFLEEVEKDDTFWECLDLWISENEIQLKLCEPFIPYGLSEEDREYLDLFKELSTEKHLFQNELATLMRQKNITKDPELYNSVNMSCALFKKIMKNKPGYVPDKETVFKLCIALQLTVNEANKLLSYAGYSFNPDSKKDIIIKYFIEKQKFDKTAQMKIDDLLVQYNEKPLFSCI